MQVPWSWSFSTLGCGDRDAAAVLELTRRSGLDRVEVRMLEGRVDLPQLLAERYGDPAGLRAACERAGVDICALDSSFRLASGDAAAREELLAFVPWAEALGVPYLRVFDGGARGDPLHHEDLAIMLENIAWWRAQRAAAGWRVDLMMETHDACLSAAAITALQARLDQALPILWDSHHPWYKSGEDLATTWAAVRDAVVHVHIKDSVSDPASERGFRYVDPGQGRFPFEERWGLLRG
ncbi:MAG: sugar phosphate isomerase/epimerase family protein, partial [Planctomycetota bacterium]